MFIVVLAQPGCPGQNPESCKMVVVVVVVYIYFAYIIIIFNNYPYCARHNCFDL